MGAQDLVYQYYFLGRRPFLQSLMSLQVFQRTY